jgi:hypothetical protein
MSNLGPHLRHNRHHTLFPAQEQPCSQSGLHLHDQQPTSKYFSKDWLSYDSLISLYGLTTHLFIGFTIGKTLNTWHPKNGYRSMQIIGYKSQISGFCYSRLQVGLPVDYQSAFIRSSVGHHMPTCRPLVG